MAKKSVEELKGMKENSNLLVAGVVVLFNPPSNAVSNILSYYKHVSKLYVIDNSTKINDVIVNELRILHKVLYLNTGCNEGIAKALNTGANLAHQEGFDFLLTMDQDTLLPEKFMCNILDFIKEMEWGNVGIISPVYKSIILGKFEHYNKVLFTMTSASVLNLKIFNKVGLFREDLFIDHVDHEYCLRLNQNGYDVVQIKNLVIDHHPGELEEIKIFGKRISFVSHSPERLYYFCRNGLFVSNLYKKTFPVFKKLFIKQLIKEAVKIIGESRKTTRIKYLLLALKHYKKGIVGMLNTPNSKNV